jgi:arylsulfatase A-like enzyme
MKEHKTFPGKSMITLASLLTAFSCTGPRDQEKINVVFILVDDLGWKDVGFMGSTYYETPNVDKLASQGMVFTNGYAAAANCAPSRACLMSGMNTPRHGIYTVSPSERGDAKTRKLIPIPNTTDLKDEIVTLAEMFKSSGYATGTFGKWHLGEDARTQGFDVNVGGSRRGGPGRDGYFAPYNIDHIEQGPDGEYLTDRLTLEAISFMNDNKNNPFFLYLPYYTVHTPLQGKQELVEKYKNKPGSHGQSHPVYAAMVDAMDQNVGLLLDEIGRLGLSEKTLVVFTSDNGGIRSISPQDPLRAGKGSYYEGGIRVPLIIKWPGVTEKGVINHTPITNLDFYPTFREIIGTEKTTQPLDGNSLVPLLKGGLFAERPLYWHFPVYLEAYQPLMDASRDPLFRTRPGTVMRLGRWKLHEYFEDGGIELYDLENDPGEALNLVSEYPEKASELHQIMIEWRGNINAPVPVQANPDYDPEFESEMIENALRGNKDAVTVAD